MKLEELRKLLISEKYLRRWVTSGSWVWNEDGSVDVLGNVEIMDHTYNRPKLPFKFRNVIGNFYCNGNLLETLENCPDEVGLNFLCSRNKLKTLEFAPKKWVKISSAKGT